jgi:hypothetical protein
VVAEAVVGAQDDGVPDGLALGGEGGEEGWGCETPRNVGDFPGEVEGVLDAGV